MSYGVHDGANDEDDAHEAVELMHPLMEDLAAQGMYDGCWWCPPESRERPEADERPRPQQDQLAVGVRGQPAQHVAGLGGAALPEEQLTLRVHEASVVGFRHSACKLT